MNRTQHVCCALTLSTVSAALAGYQSLYNIASEQLGYESRIQDTDAIDFINGTGFIVGIYLGFAYLLAAVCNPEGAFNEPEVLGDSNASDTTNTSDIA